MSKRTHIKGRMNLPLSYKDLSITVLDLVSALPLTRKKALEAVSATDQYPKRWNHFRPLFLPCGTVPTIWAVIWLLPSERPPAKEYDRMVCCLVWRDAPDSIRLNSVYWRVSRQCVDHTTNGWDTADLGPDDLVLSRNAQWIPIG